MQKILFAALFVCAAILVQGRPIATLCNTKLSYPTYWANANLEISDTLILNVKNGIPTVAIDGRQKDTKDCLPIVTFLEDTLGYPLIIHFSTKENISNDYAELTENVLTIVAKRIYVSRYTISDGIGWRVEHSNGHDTLVTMASRMLVTSSYFNTHDYSAHIAVELRGTGGTIILTNGFPHLESDILEACSKLTEEQLNDLFIVPQEYASLPRRYYMNLSPAREPCKQDGPEIE